MPIIYLMTTVEEFTQILEEICTHPISQVFRFPMVRSPYVDEDYEDEITTPIDLTRIQSRISSGRYTIGKFERDMTLIYTNATRYFGLGSEFSNCGAALLNVFYKAVAKRNPRNPSWGLTATRLHAKIARLLDDAPLLAKRSPSYGLDLGRPIQPQLVTEAELRSFAKASKQLCKREDVEHMTKIIEEGEPGRMDQAPKAKIDLTRLRSATARQLIDYAKTKFQEMGMQYPRALTPRATRAS
jgi:hypothetical protein